MTPIPQPNFDRVAHLYRWAEYLTLGPLLSRARNHFLPQLPPRHRALILGDGDGRFLARLLAQQPHLHALAVDTSASMLHLLRHRCRPHAGRLCTLQTSALDLFPSTKSSTLATVKTNIPEAPGSATIRYPEVSTSGLLPPLENHSAGSPRLEPWVSPDLITTHFFLDCLTQPELDALTRRIAAHTAPGALWLLSDFGPPRPRVLRPFAALYIRSLYLAFRILTGLRVTQLPNPQSSLHAAGFDRIARHDLLFGLIYTEIWQRQ